MLRAAVERQFEIIGAPGGSLHAPSAAV